MEFIDPRVLSFLIVDLVIAWLAEASRVVRPVLVNTQISLLQVTLEEVTGVAHIPSSMFAFVMTTDAHHLQIPECLDKELVIPFSNLHLQHTIFPIKVLQKPKLHVTNSINGVT